MILNGQHSVTCFCYAPMGMHFKIDSVPDPLHDASQLDAFIDKTRMVMFLLTFFSVHWLLCCRRIRNCDQKTNLVVMQMSMLICQLECPLILLSQSGENRGHFEHTVKSHF